jgi:hypothetical protein
MKNLLIELIKSDGKYSSRRAIAIASFFVAVVAIIINAAWAIIWGTLTTFMPVETSIVLALLGIGTAATASAGFGKTVQTKESDVIEP